MEIILLSIIAGLIGVDIYFKHGNGELNLKEMNILLGMVLLSSGIFWGIAYLFSKLV